MRVDFNIQGADLQGRTPLRIKSVLPTVKFLTGRRAKVVILSHRGRPSEIKSLKLKIKRFSLKPFVKILSKLLKKQVKFIDFNFGTSDVFNIKNSMPGSIFLLENLRFNPAEEKTTKTSQRNWLIWEIFTLMTLSVSVIGQMLQWPRLRNF